jgi:hypothetical protein
MEVSRGHARTSPPPPLTHMHTLINCVGVTHRDAHSKNNTTQKQERKKKKTLKHTRQQQPSLPSRPLSSRKAIDPGTDALCQLVEAPREGSQVLAAKVLQEPAKAPALLLLPLPHHLNCLGAMPSGWEGEPLLALSPRCRALLLARVLLVRWRGCRLSNDSRCQHQNLMRH